MLDLIGRVILAGVLAVAALAKLRQPRAAAAGMGTFGFRSDRGRLAAVAFVIGAELVLAAGVALGSSTAAYAAAGLMLLFAATLGSALMAGRAGAPCACFGARSTVSWRAIARNLALAAAFAVLPALP